jgi:hypothetical protein
MSYRFVDSFQAAGSGWKLYMFQTVPMAIIRSYSLYTQQWYTSYRFVDSFRAAGSGWNSSSILILIHPDSKINLKN